MIHLYSESLHGVIIVYQTGLYCILLVLSELFLLTILKKSTFCPPAARQKTVAYFRPNNGTTTVAIESNFDIYAFKNKEFKNV